MIFFKFLPFRKFVCDICGKKFFENYFLQQHRKVHKAEAALPGMTEADLKSYTCDKCKSIPTFYIFLSSAVCLLCVTCFRWQSIYDTIQFKLPLLTRTSQT